MPAPDPALAHRHAAHHRAEVQASAVCGCYFCLATFEPREIEDWADWPDGTPPGKENARGTTALCPRCGMESVIGSASGLSIDSALLRAMHDYWFPGVARVGNAISRSERLRRIIGAWWDWLRRWF
ncbi:MAG: hypothetical protein ACREVL_03040 [Solimonas sp.]